MSQQSFLDTVFDEGASIGPYTITDFLGGGNSGEVYRVAEPDHGRSLALKVFMPIFQAQQLSLFQEFDAITTTTVLEQAGLSIAEYRFLSRIDHPFVVQVFGSGEVELSSHQGARLRGKLSGREAESEYKGQPFKLPYIVTSYVDGSRLDKALEALDPLRVTPGTVARTLLSIAQGIEYLHEHHRYLHADIKPANVLIRRVDGFPMLIDFALCKNLNFEDNEADPDEMLRLQVDWSLTPDEQLPKSHPFHKLMRDGGTRREIRKQLFPWLDFYQYGRMLALVELSLNRLLPAGDERYVAEMIRQLTDWDRVTRLKHGDLTRLAERVGLSRTYRSASPQAAGGGEDIPLANGRRVVVPPELSNIRFNTSFNRLANVNQLSFLSFVHPGATHTRLLHVYETLRVTQALVLRLSEVPAFRLRFGSEEVTQLLALALLHDINHFPFLHLFQESELPGLDDFRVVDVMCDGERTGENRTGEPSVYEILHGIGLDPERFKRLVLGSWARQQGPNVDTDRITNSILKSGVDVDKLSYLPLDSELSGLNTALGLGVDELMRAASVIHTSFERVSGYHLAYVSDALPQVEAAMNARYWSFVQLYWSPENRAMMALFFGVVRRLFGKGRQNVTDFILDHIFSTDQELLKNLEDNYQDTFQESSGLLEMLRQPHTRPVPVLASHNLFERLKRKTNEDRIRAERQLAETLGTQLGLAADSPHEVLIDVPARELDVGGATLIEYPDGEVKRVEEVSPAAEKLQRRYEDLSHTATIFASPRLANALGEKAKGDSYAVKLLVEDALAEGLVELQ